MLVQRFSHHPPDFLAVPVSLDCQMLQVVQADQMVQADLGHQTVQADLVLQVLPEDQVVEQEPILVEPAGALRPELLPEPSAA